MTPLTRTSLCMGAVAALALAFAVSGRAASPAMDTGAPQYTPDGKLIPPTDYREWVFLSSGIDMSYSERATAPGMHMFDNVFAPRAAYDAFKRTGVWPDKTVLMLENRSGATKGSINKAGQFQTGQVMGAEAHVKDAARFKGGWGFFGGLAAGKPGSLIPYTVDCYSCHEQHAAADTTFVQFYPTLLPVATKLGTLSPAYLAEEAARK